MVLVVVLVDPPVVESAAELAAASVDPPVEELGVEGYENEHNMWEYVGDLKEGANDRSNGRRLTFARR